MQWDLPLRLPTIKSPKWTINSLKFKYSNEKSMAIVERPMQSCNVRAGRLAQNSPKAGARLASDAKVPVPSASVRAK
ncbi:hypothetical protein GCM10022255_112350 [Dactylosporangium darangshiense]|uniref:Uncharacterized protein n=1 Tax=Dactylosporangium darangshiense TaxID=579108 RepID=A0ABP8DVH3_9ACTN